jgi:hypothetical protein
VTILNDGSKHYETKMAVGMVGAPSSGIELVLKQISLPVAQIRLICKNGPQVSIDDIKSEYVVAESSMKKRCGSLKNKL